MEKHCMEQSVAKATRFHLFLSRFYCCFIIISILLSLRQAAYAVGTIDVYFDNYYTQFERVTISGAPRFSVEEQYEFQEVEDGILKVQLPTNLVSLRFCIYDKRFGDEGTDFNDFDFKFHLDMPSDNTIFYIGYDSVCSCDYTTYSRPVWNEYDKNMSPLSFHNDFNAPISELSMLTIGNEEIIDFKKISYGPTWLFCDGYLYIGIGGDFSETINATGNLTIMVVGGENAIPTAIIDGNININILNGILRMYSNISADSLTLNVSSYGTIIIGDEHRPISVDYLEANIEKNGMIELPFGGAGSRVYITCSDAVINNNGNLRCIFGGGGSNCGILATNSLTLNGNPPTIINGGGGGNEFLWCDEGITYSTVGENSDTHKMHLYSNELQYSADLFGENADCTVKRCVICGCVISDYIAEYPGIVVSLDKTESILSVGDQDTLAATIYPESNAVNSLIWSTSDESIATIEDGLVTALSPGVAIITAKTTADSEISAACAIVVPDLILPASLSTIGEEAFSGGAFACVQLLNDTVNIGKNAFANCPNLVSIYIPAETISIDPLAFGDMLDLTIIGKTDTILKDYADEHDFTFIAIS